MTKLTAKRIEIIERIIKHWGIDVGDYLLISIWDLAHNINNTWNARHFVNTKNYRRPEDIRRFVLDWYLIYEQFNAIRDAVKKSPLFVLKKNQSNNVEFIIMELPE